MNKSDILRLFAQANRKCGKETGKSFYSKYAETLENAAAVYEANEILNEDKHGKDKEHTN